MVLHGLNVVIEIFLKWKKGKVENNQAVFCKKEFK